MLLTIMKPVLRVSTPQTYCMYTACWCLLQAAGASKSAVLPKPQSGPLSFLGPATLTGTHPAHSDTWKSYERPGSALQPRHPGLQDVTRLCPGASSPTPVHDLVNIRAPEAVHSLGSTVYTGPSTPSGCGVAPPSFIYGRSSESRPERHSQAFQDQDNATAGAKSWSTVARGLGAWPRAAQHAARTSQVHHIMLPGCCCIAAQLLLADRPPTAHRQLAASSHGNLCLAERC